MAHHLHDHQIGCTETEAHNIMNIFLADFACLPLTRQAAAIEVEQKASENISPSIANSPARNRSAQDHWPLHSDSKIHALHPSKRPKLSYSPNSAPTPPKTRARFKPMVAEPTTPPNSIS